MPEESQGANGPRFQQRAALGSLQHNVRGGRRFGLRRQPDLNQTVLFLNQPGVQQQVIFSFQLRVLRLGFLQDGDVGVGVFPQCEKSW
jgi:hypothetical protein